MNVASNRTTTLDKTEDQPSIDWLIEIYVIEKHSSDSNQLYMFLCEFCALHHPDEPWNLGNQLNNPLFFRGFRQLNYYLCV